MTSEHTPGEWTTKGPSRAGDFAIVVGDDIHAECYAAIRAQDERATGECHANAHLIAASPKMKEALDEAWIVLDTLRHEKLAPIVLEGIESTFAKICEAKAKAEGQS